MAIKAFESVALVGACGKMGRGIAELLLQEMTLQGIQGKQDDLENLHLRLIDPNESAFYSLKAYLEAQLVRFGEKNINQLRTIFAKDPLIVSNSEAVNAFKTVGLRILDCSKEIESVQGSKFVFEAAFEDIPLKVSLLKKVHALSPEAWVFTNTSSIPIHLLAKESGIGKNLIGFHFYNPPAVQKLLEIIPSTSVDPQLLSFSMDLAKRLNKTVVVANDVAGFIGNGHFSREIAFAFSLVLELSNQYPMEEAIQIVDTVTREYLLRPMGIFQLLDYVGLQVAANILEIIQTYGEVSFIEAEALDRFIKSGLKGGQTMEGRAKSGIFQIENGHATGVYSLSKKGYVPLSDMKFLGENPISLSWKKIQKDPGLKTALPKYFEELASSKSLGASLAIRFLKKSSEIEKALVYSKVANNIDDVANVLKTGFFHLYSPHEVV